MKTCKALNILFALFTSCLILSACQAGQGDGASPDESYNHGGSTSTGNPIGSVGFSLQGAVGLALAGSPGQDSLAAVGEDASPSNLKRVNVDNSLTDAVSSGSVDVLSFMVASDNQVYLLLATPVESCILIRVNGETNEAFCVDPTLTSIGWNNAFGEPVQFDEEGNIYYEGGTSDGRTVLRQNFGGETTDLITDYISLKGFLVLDDGTVFVSGTTTPTEREWTRIITPARSLENILTFELEFMAVFPDDNIYYGASRDAAVGRYLVSSGDLDPVSWISNDGVDAYYDCPGDSSNCGDARSLLRTTSGKVYASVPDGGGRDVLVQFYPDPTLPPTSIADVTVSEAILTYLILAGTDSGAANKLVLFETNSDSETDLLGSEDIEVYHLDYLNLSSQQIVMFDGLRFSDNSYVLCQVDLTDGNTLLCSKTGLGKLTDFQLFNSAD